MSSSVRLGSMAGGPSWWKWSKWIGDRGTSCWTSSSKSTMESVLFFFQWWMVSMRRKLLSNWWTIEAFSQTNGISNGGGLLVSTTIEDFLASRRLGLWAPCFSCLLVWGWVRGGGTYDVGLTFFTWGSWVSSKGGVAFGFLNAKPSLSLLVSLSVFRRYAVDEGYCFIGVALLDT